MSRPVVTMPGKMGDVLLALPVAREIAAMHRAPVTFITSAYCAPLLPLITLCDYVHGVIAMSEDQYKVEHTHFGAQPWLMPVEAEPMENTYHLGFRHFPLSGQPVSWLAGEPYAIRPEPGPWLPRVRVDPAGPVLVELGTHVAIAGWAALHGRPIRWLSTPPRRVIGDDIVLSEDYFEIHEALQGCSMFVGAQSGPSKVAMGAGVPVVWPHREGVEQARWVHPGCDVRTVDHSGQVRRLELPR